MEELENILEKIEDRLDVIIKDAKDLGESGVNPDFVKGQLSVARKIKEMIIAYYAMPAV